MVLKWVVIVVIDGSDYVYDVLDCEYINICSVLI